MNSIFPGYEKKHDVIETTCVSEVKTAHKCGILLGRDFIDMKLITEQVLKRRAPAPVRFCL